MIPVRSKLALSLITGLLLVAISCARLMPAGFWRSYQEDFIVARSSDQGPWGGSRWIHWVAKDEHTFTPALAADYATAHGWTCAEPVEYSAERMRNWHSGQLLVFPLFDLDLVESPHGFSTSDSLTPPRHIVTDSYIIKCETNWMRCAPGSGEMTQAYGYILISKDGTRMAVYHLWGDV